MGGNVHINRIHLVSARLNPSRNPYFIFAAGGFPAAELAKRLWGDFWFDEATRKVRGRGRHAGLVGYDPRRLKCGLTAALSCVEKAEPEADGRRFH